MMTTLLCGVNDLEEESLLDVELERRADDVSEDFFRILHDVVSQAEALSCQLDAQGTLLTFQDFVTKVRPLLLMYYGCRRIYMTNAHYKPQIGLACNV